MYEQIFNFLASIYSWAGRFEYQFDRNPEDGAAQYW